MVSHFQRIEPAIEANPELVAHLRNGVAQSPIWRWYNITVEWAAEGACRLKMPVHPSMINADDQTLHGGIIATLVDEAVGAAMSTFHYSDSGVRGFTTTELSVSYLEGVLTSEVHAEGRILRNGRTLVVGQADILDGMGKLCARGRVTYMTFR